jgi:hypothetical protein
MPLISRAVLDFLLYDWLDATSLTKLSRFAEHNRELLRADAKGVSV